jgi:hypothetical protein
MTFGKDWLGIREGFARNMCKQLRWYWGYLRTFTGPCHGLLDDFWQELTGCQKQLSPKFVQVAEFTGDTRVLLMDLVMTFHHATGVKIVWNHRFYSCYCTVIWDHISNPEQEGSDDLYYTFECVLQYAPRNLITTNRHLLEYVLRTAVRTRVHTD